MKKILLVATALVAGMTVGLTQAEDADAAKGAKGSKSGKGGDPAARVQMMLEKVDTDKSGTISKEEFAASPMATKIKEARGEDAVEKMFAMRDKNKDGELDKKELAAPPKGGGKGGKGGKGAKTGESDS